MHDRKTLPGKFVWFELVSQDARKAQAFYREVLGWRVESFPMPGYAYEMLYADKSPDSMIGGFKKPRSDQERSRWIAYVSVPDIDAAAKAATAHGGKVIEAPVDIPDVGRKAGITDPQGAELYLLRNAKGDPPDGDAPIGRFFWNELHTSDPKKALTFYEKVIGFTHHSKDMGPGGTYHILAKDGIDRGGITGHLPHGAPPHWLPYVHVDDVDDTIDRARKLGAAVPMAPEDIPAIGRFGILADPTGATLAVMKPMPMEPPHRQAQIHEAGARR